MYFSQPWSYSFPLQSWTTDCFYFSHLCLPPILFLLHLGSGDPRTEQWEGDDPPGAETRRTAGNAKAVLSGFHVPCEGKYAILVHKDAQRTTSSISMWDQWESKAAWKWDIFDNWANASDMHLPVVFPTNLCIELVKTLKRGRYSGTKPKQDLPVYDRCLQTRHYPHGK